MSADADAVLIVNVEVNGAVVDLRIESAVVVAIGAGLDRSGAPVIVDGHGGALINGLHDHHMHVMALAAALQSVPVGPPQVMDAQTFASVLRQAALLPQGQSGLGWIRAVGYHESVAGPLDRLVLDALVETVPLRVQHRSGAQWVLNSAGLALVDVDTLPANGVERDDAGIPTGRLTGIDHVLRWRWSTTRNRMYAGDGPDVAAVGRLLASYGVTGITDATPYASTDDYIALVEAQRRGRLRQRLTVMGAPHLTPSQLAPLRSGPAKIMMADHDLPSFDEMVALVRQARNHGRAVAVHCVSRVALVVALAVLEEVGVVPGDRIEHGALVDQVSVTQLAVMGVCVVTQPNFVAERGDRYRVEVDARDLDDLYRCGALLSAGVPVAGSTDAPFGHPDPWRAISAAVERRTVHGQVLGGGEAVTPLRALQLFQGAADAPGEPITAIVAGQAADLCLLGVPLAEALQAPTAGNVRATFIAGDLVFGG